MSARGLRKKVSSLMIGSEKVGMKRNDGIRKFKRVQNYSKGQ